MNVGLGDRTAVPLAVDEVTLDQSCALIATPSGNGSDSCQPEGSRTFCLLPNLSQP